MPGAGKTTVARAVAEQLRFPLVTKDDLKERLYDELGTGDVEWSRRLGAAAYALLFALCREVLAAGQPVAAEANFFAGSQEAEFEALPPHRLVQVHCAAPLDVLLERYANRARHPGHLDDERAAELRERFETGLHAPLALAGELIEVDTTGAVDAAELAEKIRVVP
jgi:predicted kinase